MKPSVFQKVSLAALASATVLLTSSCGGGGSGGDDASPPPPSSESPIEPEAITSVPEPVYSDPRTKSAFDRINQIRSTAGLGLIRQNTLVDQAAYAHSVYQLNNSEFGHSEIRGRPYFTGEASISRVVAAGYSKFNATSEVTVTLSFDSGIPNKTGANLVDTLMGAPYHRKAILSHDYPEMGIGAYSLGNSATLTVNYVGNDSDIKSENNMQGAPQTPISIWPPENGVDIPTTMYAETPNPIPENNGASAGYPASVQTDIKFRSIDASRFEIRDSLGTLVSTKLLNYETNTSNGSHAFAAALPRTPLKANETYSVYFEGYVVDVFNGNKTSIIKSWNFSTGNKVYY